MEKAPRRNSAPKLNLFAVAPPGLEQILLDELADLGIPKLMLEDGGVSFRGDLRTLYRVNLHSRVASRVLLRVARFHASEFHELERNANRIRWGGFVSSGSRVTLRVTCRKSKLYHSDAVAERIGNAIVTGTGARVATDAGEEAADEAAEANSEGERSAAQLFVVRLFRDECSISADSSGAHLHMRGYREALGRAPMRETLAAALIRASGWRADRPLIDPMCGAGTIPIEAALLARRIAPGLARASRKPRVFSFEQWTSHDPLLWSEVVDAAQAEILDRAPVRILACDHDAVAVRAASQNALRAGVESDLEISQQPISAIVAAADKGLLMVNPPYGKRMGEEKPLRDLYASLGNILRSRFSGWELILLSGNSVLDRHSGLMFQKLARTSNGGIPVSFLRSIIP